MKESYIIEDIYSKLFWNTNKGWVEIEPTIFKHDNIAKLVIQGRNLKNVRIVEVYNVK